MSPANCDVLSLFSLLKDLALVIVGAAIGFFFSMVQWRYAMKDAEKNRNREKLETLVAQLSRFSELVRQVIHRRSNHLYYPEVGPDPRPEIHTLAAIYAPEIRERFNDICALYGETVERIANPAPDRFEPIYARIRELQSELKEKVLKLS
jgi:hypothetical protein